MAMKSAPTDHVVPDHLSFPRLDALALTSDDVKDTAQPTIKQVVGPDGRRLTFADLPLPDTKRWVIRRKAEIVAAVRGGLLSLDEACSRYALNPDELLSWQNCIDRFGLPGLRTTRTQFYLRDVANPKSLRIPYEAGVRVYGRLERNTFHPSDIHNRHVSSTQASTVIQAR
jgi:uncharacterized protein DUF1153